MIFKNSKHYDLLKTIALLLPLFITFIAAIGEVWEIENIDKITLSLTALNGLLGGIVKLANVNYNRTELINEYDQEEENSSEIETNELGDEDV
ncbi:MAG: hypothetical protein IIZ67_02405 [Bacilli bacterium]|nr:hypothetical protein [Bacilli bacterium]